MAQDTPMSVQAAGAPADFHAISQPEPLLCDSQLTHLAKALFQNARIVQKHTLKLQPQAW